MKEENNKKLGLALSGGGFRASFYHIGVLARLADLGLLRSVEFISTVSGGSIIGALYYLHLKKLLEEKSDVEIKDEDYQKIVAKIEVDFLKAIQKNLRLRTFLNPIKNIKMIFPNYSRSDHIGELYDKFLYRKVLDTNNTQPIKMKDLIIKPCCESNSFHPLKDNKNRSAKVPILLINATLLNNGHNWCFSASDMGETQIDQFRKKFDKNFRLKKIKSYEDIYKHEDFELGLAVAASACVPGIFAPLAISDLYDEKVRLQLVDGGVHDNQGIRGLLDKRLNCTHFIISDASAQLKDEREPNVQISNVIKRSNGILADNLREQQLSHLIKEHSDNVALLHLKKGLPVKEVSYFDERHNLKEESKFYNTEQPCETFRVNTDVQNLLSGIRTDLDSFSEVEAFSLMLNGYRISQYELDKVNIKSFVTNTALKEERYQFFKIDSWISSPIIDSYYKNLLETASKRFFKAIRINLLVKYITILLIVLICGTIISTFGSNFIYWANESISKGQLLLLTLLLITLFIVYKGLKFFSQRILSVWFLINLLPFLLVSLTGVVFIGLYLITFDRLFLYLGSFKVLKKVKTK
ncbi:patatin-like phospholipase family protein [Bacillus cereus]|uniref:patatin-like phospholipase family protein n=1 Tax=Bacillus cereus TaxID=1396 RepID=UPI000C292515|nr:patatin-like phospholipase family protein [Bacillus cereus]